MIDVAECGEVGGMIGLGNTSARTNSIPLTPCPPRVTHDLTDLPKRCETGCKMSRIPHFLDNLDPYGTAALYPQKNVVVLIFVRA
jgi:hypothetical protein